MTHRPLPDQRWYTTPALIREIQDFDPAVTDVILRGQILVISKLIDQVTSQSFWPLIGSFVTRGQGDFLIKHPSNLPFIDVSLVEYNASRSLGYIFDWTDPLLHEVEGWTEVYDSFFEIRERGIFAAMKTFPEGFKNVRVTGVFGWLENSRGKIETETVSPVSAGDTTVDVLDASAFVKRDIVDLEGPDSSTPMRAIIEDIDYGTNKFTIDLVQDPTDVPAGSAVTSWGQVPNLIELVIARWIGRILSLGTGVGGIGPIIPPGKLKRERTDSYEYERYDLGDSEVSGELTGDPMLDRILTQYSAPLHIGFV